MFTIKIFFLEVFKDLGLTEKDVDNFYNERNNEKRYLLFDRTKNYLERLKEKGLILGVFTNGRPSRRRVLESLEIENYFSKRLIFISDEIGLSKPNLSAFKYVKRKLNNSVYFVDDDIDSLKTAEEIGWISIKMDHNKEGFTVLEKIIN